MSPLAKSLLYCVSGYNYYLLECVDSIQSAREYCPDLAVCVVSDLEERAGTLKRYADEVILIDPPNGQFVPWGAGLLQKIKALRLSPFEQTLYLDTDTRIITPEVKRIFGKLECVDIAMAEAIPSESPSRRMYGRFMYNTGVIILGTRCLLEDFWLHGKLFTLYTCRQSLMARKIHFPLSPT